MDIVSIGLGLLVNTCVKNKAVNTAIDDFVTDSVNWVRGWFKKSHKVTVINTLVAAPDSSAAKEEASSAMQEMIKDPDFKAELERWIAENHKPNPSIKNVITKKNVVKDANIEVAGNVKIGDKNSDGSNYDQKNVIDNSTIKSGGDFTLGDG
ncbi:hypothetical protein BTO09_07555 [Gilvibacter sp. SZ-19]|uniref:hypothetical protein n=1 Tax=Gilvibacter sp. SZ-19 TaxID=754429 RepID=UPI000B3D09B7|nr:hypothetical protein [Gilvibacter sp. SZ-19]ARV12216.1 hypothetical protein BTO09_07555 [Gilvibacter sp. SZ-19]